MMEIKERRRTFIHTHITNTSHIHSHPPIHPSTSTWNPPIALSYARKIKQCRSKQPLSAVQPALQHRIWARPSWRHHVVTQLAGSSPGSQPRSQDPQRPGTRGYRIVTSPGTRNTGPPPVAGDRGHRAALPSAGVDQKPRQHRAARPIQNTAPRVKSTGPSLARSAAAPTDTPLPCRRRRLSSACGRRRRQSCSSSAACWRGSDSSRSALPESPS